MDKFFNFDTFFLPKLVKYVFILLTFLYLFIGISYMFSGESAGVIIGLLIIIVGPFFARLICEITIIPFKIYEKLAIIADKKSDDNNNIINQ